MAEGGCGRNGNGGGGEFTREETEAIKAYYYYYFIGTTGRKYRALVGPPPDTPSLHHIPFHPNTTVVGMPGVHIIIHNRRFPVCVCVCVSVQCPCPVLRRVGPRWNAVLSRLTGGLRRGWLRRRSFVCSSGARARGQEITCCCRRRRIPSGFHGRAKGSEWERERERVRKRRTDRGPDRNVSNTAAAVVCVWFWTDRRRRRRYIIIPRVHRAGRLR